MELSNYATKGIANAGLVTGIIGTAGTALNMLNGGSSILGAVGGRSSMGEMAQVAQTVADIAGVTNKCSDNMPVTRHELDLTRQIMERDNAISLLKSEQNTEVKIADVYERIMTRVNQDQRDQAAWNASQAVNNATMSAAIATNANSISALEGCCNKITKLVVPKDAICPEYMTRYNSWTAPTD